MPLIAALTVAAYWNVARFEFVSWDDPHYVTTNARVMAGLSWDNIIWAFTTDHPPYWHPVTWFSHMTDVQLFGLDPSGPHVVNLVLHVVNSALLFGLLSQLTGRPGPSMVVTAFFALHPLNVESVAWVAERKNLLSTTFWILTTWQYYRYVSQPVRRKYILMMVFFLLGLMTKPMLVTLPFTLLLLDIWPLRRVTLQLDQSVRKAWIEAIVEKTPMFAAAVLAALITFAMQPGTGSLGDLEALPVSYRLQNALVSYALYVVKMFFPFNLAALYPLPATIPQWSSIIALFTLISVTLIAFRGRKSYPYALVGWLWFVGTLIPVIGLVQAGDQSMADRFFYVSGIGLLVVVVFTAADLLKRFNFQGLAVSSGVVVVVVALVVVTRAQAEHWRTSMALWSHALEVTARNHRAENLLANELVKIGDVRGALSHYDAALRINPNFADAHNGKGSVYQAQNRLDSAYNEYLQAIRLNPGLPEAHNNIGNILVDAGNVDEAMKHYRAGLAIAPDSPELRTGLGAALSEQGNYDEALEEFLAVARLRPDADAEFNVAMTFAAKRQPLEARSHLEAALRIDPRHQQAQEQLRLLTSGGEARK